MSTPRDATVGNGNDARDQHTPPLAPAGWQQTGERGRERREEGEEEGKEKACRHTRHGSESREGVKDTEPRQATEPHPITIDSTATVARRQQTKLVRTTARVYGRDHEAAHQRRAHSAERGHARESAAQDQGLRQVEDTYAQRVLADTERVGMCVAVEYDGKPVDVRIHPLGRAAK